MKVTIASDHEGFGLKSRIVEWLRKVPNITVQDKGPLLQDPVDYPDYVQPVVQDVLSGQADRGVLITATGMEAAMVANRFPGIRAAACHNLSLIHYARKALNSNLLCLPSQDIDGCALISVWLYTPYNGNDHTIRCLQKLAAIESTLS